MSVVAKKPRLSSMVRNMSESETLKMAQMARNLRAQGHDVISLAIGEPDFDTPDHIKMAAIKALTEGFTKYTPVPGIPELLDAVSKKFKRDNDLDYAPNQIVVSNGAKQSISNVAFALLEEGDECIIFAPYWVSYIEIVRMTGATPVIVSAGVEQDYKVTAEQVEAAITERTKMVLFSSPCNPSGAVFTKSELHAIADVIGKYEDIVVVSDEIYEYINYTDAGNTSIGTFESVKDRTVTVNGFAKGFAMTGWRLGFIGAPKWIADACNKIQGQYTSGANSFSQKAAVVALNSGLEASYKMRDEFRKRRDMCIDLLSEIPGFKVPTPEGAFYIFPNISTYFGKSDGTTTIKNADDFADYVMLNAYVGVVSGGAFGAPDCFRLSYAASEAQLREAIRRIKEVCARLS
ncbi:MAG: pyridoxal phosphate-dependent aminotransferase [Saprospiraceae bacterium]|nr:pyridoxal phosphate-dependent aminotransferase [Saprospiraceae bacterium]